MWQSKYYPSIGLHSSETFDYIWNRPFDPYRGLMVQLSLYKFILEIRSENYSEIDPHVLTDGERAPTFDLAKQSIN